VVGKEHVTIDGGRYMLEGKATYWFADGQKLKEGRHEKGEPDGEWSYWHKNGVKAAEGSYVDGNRDGLWTRWDEAGKTISEAVFDRGMLVKGTWVDLPEQVGPESSRREIMQGWDDGRDGPWISRSNNYLAPRRSEMWTRQRGADAEGDLSPGLVEAIRTAD
jgi:hypothetical protein